MTPGAVRMELYDRDVALSVVDGALKYSAPEGALTPALLAARPGNRRIPHHADWEIPQGQQMAPTAPAQPNDHVGFGCEHGEH